MIFPVQIYASKHFRTVPRFIFSGHSPGPNISGELSVCVVRINWQEAAQAKGGSADVAGRQTGEAARHREDLGRPNSLPYREPARSALLGNTRASPPSLNRSINESVYFGVSPLVFVLFRSDYAMKS
ncbi:hypothetical protein PoB_000540600 [Plakobranchus ocellatus]|uniref:Uncharacterized protein n=1 Tax=Plakobranchus ocellatus TaxID=259542 RepID=A0AAV3Y6Q8_9GAST|nr:hypothetical protein PoB_000540600 [Plakobranchus ocellatus]